VRPLALAITLAHADARAATITVTDGGDAGTSSTCTLRQAIVSANKNAHGSSACSDGSGADTIVFADALAASTITLAGSELAITGPLTIIGSGQTIDANHASRVMYVGNTTMSASNLTLTNGDFSGNSGAGLFVIGSTVNLDQVVVSGNTSDNAAGIAALNSTSLTLSNSTVSGNSATFKGGGLQVANNTMVTLANSVVSGNYAERGANVFAGYNGQLMAQRSSISANAVTASGPQNGGGIYGYRCSGVTLVDTTVSGDSGKNQGGGIFVEACPLLLVNSTVAENTSETSGGGIYVGNGSATLINSTISANGATEAGGLQLHSATLALANTIVSANTVDAAYLASADVGSYKSTVDAHYSLLGSALSTGVLDASSASNIFGDAPGLGPLQDNGGPTWTMALLVTSPAIDAGSNALAYDGAHALIYDQRPGQARIAGGSVDIGAFEYQSDRIYEAGFEALP
jgi:predicted outer membrane repeat protein